MVEEEKKREQRTQTYMYFSGYLEYVWNIHAIHKQC